MKRWLRLEIILLSCLSPLKSRLGRFDVKSLNTPGCVEKGKPVAPASRGGTGVPKPSGGRGRDGEGVGEGRRGGRGTFVKCALCLGPTKGVSPNTRGCSRSQSARAVSARGGRVPPMGFHPWPKAGVIEETLKITLK